MSTDYIPIPDLQYTRLEAGLPQGLYIDADATERELARSGYLGCMCITDGYSYLWAYRAPDGTTSFTRYGSNNVEEVVGAIEGEYGVELIDEHDD